jgi:hypothetical protein
MRMSRLLDRTVPSLCAAMLLAGCGGAQSLISTPGTSQQTSAVAARADRGGSWMLPEAKGENLMYVSDVGMEGVVVYAYRRPQYKYVGFLLGLATPDGECVDKAQNIYVAESSVNGGGAVFEYRHGETTPINILGVDGFAENCAVDLTTGNLAVIAYKTGGSGAIFLFKKARGKPVVYTDNGFNMYACAYDAKGDLFVDGFVESIGVQITEMPKGSTQFRNITLNQSLSTVGNLQWARGRLAVGDAYQPVIYRFDIAGSEGTEVGSTPLSGSEPTIAQFFIAADRVIVPTEPQDYGGYVKIYHYPAGGNASRTLSNFSIPVAVVVSYAQ